MEQFLILRWDLVSDKGAFKDEIQVVQEIVL